MTIDQLISSHGDSSIDDASPSDTQLYPKIEGPKIWLPLVIINLELWPLITNPASPLLLIRLSSKLILRKVGSGDFQEINTLQV